MMFECNRPGWLAKANYPFEIGADGHPRVLEACVERHRSPLVLQCLHDYLAGKRFPLDLIWNF